jgi:hypothetical protein
MKKKIKRKNHYYPIVSLLNKTRDFLLISLNLFLYDCLCLTEASRIYLRKGLLQVKFVLSFFKDMLFLIFFKKCYFFLPCFRIFFFFVFCFMMISLCYDIRIGSFVLVLAVRILVNLFLFCFFKSFKEILKSLVDRCLNFRFYPLSSWYLQCIKLFA